MSGDLRARLRAKVYLRQCLDMGLYVDHGNVDVESLVTDGCAAFPDFQKNDVTAWATEIADAYVQECEAFKKSVRDAYVRHFGRVV